jgi:hypothetical protein
MKISDAFPSKYIKADDIGHHRLNVTVRIVTIEDIADKEFKPVMYFMGKDKGMVINKTNAGICAAVWGDETDHWQGKALELFAQPVMFQGRQVMGLAVSPVMTAPPAQRTNDEITQAQFQQPGPHDQRVPFAAGAAGPAAAGSQPAQHPIPDSVVAAGPAAMAAHAEKEATTAAAPAPAAPGDISLDDIPF